MIGLCFRFWINVCEKILLASKYCKWIINFISLCVIPTKNLLVVFLFKRIQFWILIHQSNCPSLDIQLINGKRILRNSTIPEAKNHPILGILFLPFFSYLLNESPLWFFCFWRSFFFLIWGCPSFHFLVYNIYSTSSPTPTYFNLFLFATASFHSLIYNINVTSSPTFTYFNLFHFANASFRFLVYNININFSPTLAHSNIFLFTTSLFTPMWYIGIKMWIEVVTCYSTCSGCLIQKTVFFVESLDLPSPILFLAFFLCSFFQFLMHSASLIDISLSYLSKDIFHVNIIRPDNWTFVVLNQRIFGYALLHHRFSTSMSHFSWLRAILYCSNNSSLFSNINAWYTDIKWIRFFRWRSNTFLVLHFRKPVWIHNMCKIPKKVICLKHLKWE